MASVKTSIGELAHQKNHLVKLDEAGFLTLPPPYDRLDTEPKIKELTDGQKQRYECSLDGICAVMLSRPETESEKKELIGKFFAGLKKLFNKNDNWTFIQPLILTMEYCAKCQTCSEACPVFKESGGVEIYRPTYRADILRRLYGKYVKTGGRILARLSGSDIDVTWEMIARLIN